MIFANGNSYGFTQPDHPKKPAGLRAVGHASTSLGIIMRMNPVPSCQCGRYDERCASSITQEDLLCDACRSGTCAKRYRGHPLGWQYDTHIAWDSDGSMRSDAAAMRQLSDTFPDGSWISSAESKPLHLVDAAGRHYLDPDAPLIPHDHNGVPCKYVPG